MLALPLLSIWLAGLGLVNTALALSFSGLPYTTTEPVVRVLLGESSVQSFRSYKPEPIRLSGGPLWLPKRAWKIRALAVQNGIVLELEDADGYLTRARLNRSVALRLRCDNQQGIWLGKQLYRGEFYLQRSSTGIQVVNHVPVEAYLASVVGGEMPLNWPLAALQAQAIAARTYALYHRDADASHYDVKATIASQIYKGVKTEALSAQKAVATTKSLVLVHSGRLINAVFHSSSGGRTETSGQVWSRELPYLISVLDHDQHSPMHRWSALFSAERMQKLFRETAGLKSIEVLEASPSGRIRSVRVYGKYSSFILSGRKLRQRLGLKSTLVSLNLLSNNPSSKWVKLSQHHKPVPLLTSPQFGKVGMSSSQEEKRKNVRRRQSWHIPASPPLPLSILRSTPLSTNKAHPALLITGGGHGHGVGMSQWGAYGLAMRGANFRQILRHYYRGVEIIPYQNSLDSLPAL
ncbi:sporulation protein [cyanobiont of Ornithocercus magnificus]|nr:sporulation protein [cyanobiont of Ornithocercus magnificus]